MKIKKNDKKENKCFINDFIFKCFLLMFSLIISYKNVDNFSYINNKIILDNNSKFAVIQKRTNFSPRGLMSYYYHNLGCSIEYINKGYIPIIDLASHPNMFNGFNSTKDKNPWEIFFYQPFNLTLKEVLNKGKNIQFIDCDMGKITPGFNIYYNNVLMNFWHNLAKIYMPIKEEFIREANAKYRYLFKRSNNVLGILLRGTDYTYRKPKGHPIQPSPEMVLEDIKNMDNKYKYKYIFLTTEDDLLRQKIINKIGIKLKFLKSKININYDYKNKSFLATSKNIKGNMSFVKTYLFNIIILSKCLDVIVSRAGGSLVAFILTKGFRNIKAYNLGLY